jgi:[acyl-carrier-protein] S-malonyltransferase
MLAEHAHAHADSHAPEWRLLVAPAAGTFRAPAGPGAAGPGAAGPGSAVAAGTGLGEVEFRGGRHAMATGFPAMIIEWLVEDGDPVSAGQPLVRLQPDSQG